VTRLQKAAGVLLLLAALAAAGIALVVWPRLFDSTPTGVGRIVAARCEGALQSGCTVTVLAISAGRLWLEASAPEADRLILDFELSPGESQPRALLLGVGASDL
jgi:hypothetical protein